MSRRRHRAFKRGSQDGGGCDWRGQRPLRTLLSRLASSQLSVVPDDHPPSSALSVVVYPVCPALSCSAMSVTLCAVAQRTHRKILLTCSVVAGD